VDGGAAIPFKHKKAMEEVACTLVRNALQLDSDLPEEIRC